MNKKGFSLIELMIAVAIMGILASVAYPSYVQYVAKGARADGLAGLMKVANLQEQYYLDNRQYATDMTKLGLAADPFVVENGFYSIDSTGTSGFVAIATALGAQASRDSGCTAIQITETGAKTPLECWE
ncbi:type IV pilin protein [Shewanella pneumatophori]|uniref:Prepilin-type N-terminal cleavage/methylation domain-containing protein n=1 Tax=Shewanella pneumatophori TaxID=314092 RepID=A0A9X2CI11_9GAMM|nr:type IV pilin protein [Shewanella pneumatophori]MCL1138934.1 prepilin-type N-terminal cleavage/methylation domain-containing protein [Shewanella pneumatophori]